MKSEIIKSLLGCGLACALGFAAPPIIGTVLAKGSFRLDGSTVLGNGTLVEGSTIETSLAGTSVQLASGARLSLGAASRGKFYGDHIVLEKGESRLENGTGFRLIALGLTIQPDRGSSTGRVTVDGSARVRVAALTGSFHVLNARGLLVANLSPGAALSFEPQIATNGAGSATRITGVLQLKDGHFVVTDEVTKVTVEVSGPGLQAEVGNRVELVGNLDAGATPVSGASQVVRISQVKRLAKAGSGGTAPAGSGGGSGAGVAVGTIAVIGGVAAAATVGGLAAVGALPGQGDNSISR